MEKLAPHDDNREPSTEELRFADLLQMGASDIQNGACVRCVASVIIEAAKTFALKRHDGPHD